MPHRGNVSTQVEFPTAVGIDITVALIYTYVMFTAIRQLINIFGIVTNIINIACFVKQGFKDPVNVSLLGLSVSDLCSLICMVGICIFLTPAVNAADLPFDSVDVAFMAFGMPQFSFTRVSSCITAMITLERCLSIVAPLKVKNILVPRRTAIIVMCIFVIFTFSITPVYVVNRLGWKYSSRRNKSIVGLVFRDDKEVVEKMTFLFNNFIIPFGAFIIVAVCTIILSTQLRSTTQWRQSTTADAQADRISSRNQRVAKMVVTISTLFIVCFVPTTITMLAIAFEPALSLNGKYVNISIIITGIGYILEGINSSINIFIYHHMSSKYRDTFRKLFNGKTKYAY